MTIHPVAPPGRMEEDVAPLSPPGTDPGAQAATETSGGLPVIPASASAAPSSPTRRLRNALLHALPAIIVGLALLALWQILTQAGAVPALFLPPPADVARSFWFSLTSPTDSLLGYAANTLIESLLGCLFGALVAIPLGYGIARSRIIASTTQPYIAASQALPLIAIAPLIVLWLGYGLTPVVALCALIVFFPLVITTVLGMRLLDKDILEAARVDGANRWTMLRHIEIPLALPSILAGLRTSLTLSITGAVVGEWVIGGSTGDVRGLGQLLVEYLSTIDGAGVFATVLALALLSSLYYGVA